MKHKFQNYFLRAPEGEPAGGGGGAPPAAPPSVLGGGAPPAGGGAPPQGAWYDTLPDEFKTNPYVTSSKDLGGFVKSAIDTKSMVGAHTIKLPGDKATDAEKAEFYNKLGRPADEKGYVPTVKPVSEGLVDPSVVESMGKVFHANGLTAAQGQAVLDGYLNILNSGYERVNGEAATRHTEGMTALKTEWGTNYDNNVKTAQLAARELGGGTELLTKLEAAGLGSDPTVIKFLHTAGMKLLDDSAVGGSGGGQFTGTQEGAAAEIGRLKVDKEFMEAWGNAQNPGHKDAVNRWLKLHEQAYPNKAAATE